MKVEEIWKDIKGYEGLYQVSNTGKIRSLDHYASNGIKDILYKGKYYLLEIIVEVIYLLDYVRKIKLLINIYIELLLKHF